MSNFEQTTTPLSFRDAIAATQALMVKMANHELNEAEIEREIAAIVSTKNGGRGFFVSYLTSDMSLADAPSLGVIEGLKTAPEVVGELLVKNLAMSSAMAVTHRRNHDRENAAASQRVARRTNNLINRVDLDSIAEELKQLQITIDTGNGSYTDFLNRWGYDAEQQEVIRQAIAEVNS